MQTVEETIIVTAQMPRAMHDELRERAERESRSLSAEIRRAVRAYLDETNDERKEA
jgi:metal-responsive CopG/Arc/MetJ family transcriptional regulator